MIPLLRLPLLLALVAAACGGEEAADAQTPSAGTDDRVAATPPEDEGTVVREDSVMQGFDAADPSASIAALEAGRSRSRLAFENDVFDLGEVYQHHAYELQFPFRVEGPDPVKITRISYSCGCTDAWIRPDWLEDEVQSDAGIPERWPISQPIPAGARATLMGEFRGERYRNDKMSKITLRSNATNSPNVLEVRAFVRPVFEAEPKRVQFGDVLAGPLRDEPVERLVEVVGMQEWEILRWKRVPRGILIEEVGEMRVREDGSAVRTLRFTVADDAPRARIASAALAETDIAGTDVDVDLELLVTARVMGAVKVTPPQRLGFGIFDAGQARTRTLTLEAVTTRVEVPDPAVEMEGAAAEVMRAEVVRRSPSLVEVKVHVPEDAPAGSYPGRLSIRFPEETGIGSHEITLTARIRQPR